MFGLFRRKECPTDIAEDEFRALYEQVQAHAETLKAVIEDSATVNTAINRIERKQNRWLDLLNIKDTGILPEKIPANPIPGMPGNGQAGIMAGEPTED